jgi:hypothetical protein
MIRELLETKKSYDILWAGMLALFLTLARKRRETRIEEYFSGLYLVSRETLISYWSDSSDLDRFVRHTCQLTEPVWCYWIEFHHAMTNSYQEGAGATYSKDLVTVLRDAARLALHDQRRKLRGKPQLEIEHVLAALLANGNLRFTKRLLRSGIRTDWTMMPRSTSSK